MDCETFATAAVGSIRPWRRCRLRDVHGGLWQSILVVQLSISAAKCWHQSLCQISQACKAARSLQVHGDELIREALKPCTGDDRAGC